MLGILKRLFPGAFTDRYSPGTETCTPPSHPPGNGWLSGGTKLLSRHTRDMQRTALGADPACTEAYVRADTLTLWGHGVIRPQMHEMHDAKLDRGQSARSVGTVQLFGRLAVLETYTL